MKKTPEDYGIIKYTWRDGLLDCHQDVEILGIGLERLPFNFGIVSGHFWCMDNKLSSLEGCPEVVKGTFNCRDNELTSLAYCPKEVHNNFYCHNNKIKSLEGCPEIINGSFLCYDNELTYLDASPRVVKGSFNCRNNKLKSLKGGPEIISGFFKCENNPFEMSLAEILSYTIKYPAFFKIVDIVENPDQQTTISNLEKKILLSNKIMGVK